MKVSYDNYMNMLSNFFHFSHITKLLHILYIVGSMNQTHAIIDLMLVLRTLKLEQPHRHNILTIAPIDPCSLDLKMKITYTFNKAL
jgi:hypothetical protein